MTAPQKQTSVRLSTDKSVPERLGTFLEVVVLDAGNSGTRQALQTASELAKGLAATIRLLVPHVVPYPLPIHSPSISRKFLEIRCRQIASDLPLPVQIDIRLCRDSKVVVESAIKTPSIVLLPGKRSWWPSSRNRWADQLTRAGHQVIFAGAISKPALSGRKPCSISSTSPLQ